MKQTPLRTSNQQPVTSNQQLVTSNCSDRFVLLHFLPVFFMYQQHTERFAFVFIQVPVMHFVRPPDRSYISIVRSREPFETLVNDHIVYQEIRSSVCHDP